MKSLILILIGLCNCFIINAQNDSVYYAKITNTRTYMNIERVSVAEYWFTKDKYCKISNQIKSIVRNDLGVICVIDLLSGTVRTDSIKPSITMSYVENTMDFKYIGQYYIPVYEWNKPKLLYPETIGDFVCEHYLCEGDADFDQISLEYMVAKTDNQFMAGTWNNLIMSSDGSGNIRDPLAGFISGNINLIILKIIETVENSISPHVTTVINVDKLELVKSSGSLFDLPGNLTNIN
jgi:hypothetical protein